MAAYTRRIRDWRMRQQLEQGRALVRRHRGPLIAFVLVAAFVLAAAGGGLALLVERLVRS